MRNDPLYVRTPFTHHHAANGFGPAEGPFQFVKHGFFDGLKIRFPASDAVAPYRKNKSLPNR